MKKRIFLLSCIILFFSCKETVETREVIVADVQELNKAIKDATPGDDIVLKNGIWKDAEISLYAKGTEEKPITLRAETPGKVFIEGKSFLHLGGEHLIVNGLFFRNGHSPSNGIIRYKIGKDSTAFHSIVTNCVIDGFTKPNRLDNDQWIQFYGKHNKIDHCYITGKSNDGETIRVFQDNNKNTTNYHQIVHNYFGPRPRKGGPRGETIRIGDSKTSMSTGHVNVSDNYFERCNGEVEIISDKTNFNAFKNNIFYKCEGSLVLRHGSYSTVDSNIFIGGDDSDFYGGLRIVSTGHWITNNYFYKINGAKFRSPLAVMNGIPMSPINRYKQVTDVVIAYNTWVDCKSTWQIGVGQNKKSVDVLPKYEIRSAPPIRSTIANNIIYNTKADNTPIINHDDASGILFKNNVLSNNGSSFSNDDVFTNASLKMKKINEWLYAPETSKNIDSVFVGYNFETIQKDIFGSSRIDKNSIGAINQLAAAENFKIDTSIYGPDWYTPEDENKKGKTLTATSTNNNLIEKIKLAVSGDIVVLTDAVYTIPSSLIIDKKITLRSKEKASKVQIIYNGDANTPLFKMYPKGNLILENLEIKGNGQQLAFTPLKENMASAYNVLVNNSTIDGFNTVLKAFKGSFADEITFQNTTIKNCANGIILAAEDKGDYNVEMLTIKKCDFLNVENNVVNFFRGGYDESTIGGILSVANSTFTSCGKKEKSGTLIKTRGIVNVDITGNTFKNNNVKYVAILWGEKNNHHKENTIISSGEIKVEEQQKLDILY